MPAVTLTDLTVKTLKPVPGKRITYLDKHLKGFGVRVTEQGQMSYVLTYGPQRKRVKIGDVGIVKLADARTKAKTILAQRQLGFKEAPKSKPYDEAVEQFLAAGEKKGNRPRTLSDYRRLLNRYGFGKTKLTEITPHDVNEKLDAIDAPSEHAHAHDALRVFFRFCIRKHLLDDNPMARAERPKARKKRKRVLTDDELKAVWNACEGMFGTIIKFCILTGQRSREIAKLTWPMIDTQNRLITLPKELTKNHREHTFPYGDMTAELLATILRCNDTAYLFPARKDWKRGRKATVYNAWNKDKPKLDERSGVNGYVIHDLRRALRTMWSGLGTPRSISRKYQNHITSDDHDEIDEIYDQYAFHSRDERSGTALGRETYQAPRGGVGLDAQGVVNPGASRRSLPRECSR